MMLPLQEFKKKEIKIDLTSTRSRDFNSRKFPEKI